MFGLFKKRAKPDFEPLRAKLFGDVALADWKPQEVGAELLEPWVSFAAARGALEAGDTASAIAALRRAAGTAGQETRQYLQAWHALRELGVEPGLDEAKRVRGVVVEVQLRDGLDTLAAYADLSARYIHHGGNLIVWEQPDPTMSVLIDAVLLAGQRVAYRIGPWEGPRRPAPPKDHVRISMLTASGLHFGEGPFDELANDPIGSPVILAATRLMKALIERAEAPET